MSDILRCAELGYIKALQDFNKEGEAFNKSHINIQPDKIINYKSEEALELFIALGNVIHKAIEVYIRLDNSKIVQDRVRFMSGIMHVDNILKHEIKTVEIWDFVRPMPRFDVKVEGGNISANVQVIFVFQDISFIPIDAKDKKKRKNYDSFIKNKDAVSIINEITKILNIQ